MTAARLSAAEAKALGLDVPAARTHTRRTAKGPYRSICHTCGFVSRKAIDEDRHLAAHPTHRRYQLDLGGET